MLEEGENIVSETRTFDVISGKTFGMRTKEELNDYRYFPEPDLSPVEVSDEWLAEIKSRMSILPNDLRIELEGEYGLSAKDTSLLTEQKELAFYFKDICKYTNSNKSVVNWIMGPIKSFLKERNLSLGEFPLSHEQIAGIIALIDKGMISFSAASQQLFPYMLDHTEESIDEAIHHLNIVQDSDSDSIQRVINEVISDLPEKVREYNKGKKGLIGMFMGEVMKKTNGKVDPKITNKLLRETLENQN